MLLEFRVKNFRSIRDWQSFSMLADSKAKELGESVMEESGFDVLSSAIIFGRNASGKSNLLMAMRASQYMVTTSAELKVDQDIPPFEPFKLCEKNIVLPVEFSIEFLSKDGMRYRYSFGYTMKEIVYEHLVFYPKSNPATLFHRRIGEKTTYGEYLTGRKKEIENLLYPNQLFLSKVGTDRIEQLVAPFTFFSEGLFVSTVHDTQFDDALIQHFTNRMGTNETPFFNENINKLLRVADTSIEEIALVEVDANAFNFPEEMSNEDKQKLVERYKFKARTIHKTFEDGIESGKVEFRLKDESTGTIKLLVVGGLILEALADGQTLVIDELDKSLHPLLTRVLVKIFQNPKTNPKKAQLIFATHDVSLLDHELFRRDQIWFAEKELEGNSHFYSISDIKGVRPNVPYEKWYMSGRFKAIPVINENELDFQIDG